MIISYILTLLGVCALAVGLLFLLRAAKGSGLIPGTEQPIRVVGRQAIGMGANLMLVEVHGQRMLIGVSRAGISILQTHDSSPERMRPAMLRREPGDDDDAHSFHAILKRAGGR